MSSSRRGRSTSRAARSMTGGAWGGSSMPAGSGRGMSCRTAFGYHLTPAGMIFENGARSGRGRGAARRDRPDRAAGAGGAGHRHDGLCRHAGLPQGDTRKGGRDGSLQPGITKAAVCGRRAFSRPSGTVMPGSRHHLPAVPMRPPISATSPTKLAAMEGHDRRRARDRRDRDPRHRRFRSRRRGGRGRGRPRSTPIIR